MLLQQDLERRLLVGVEAEAREREEFGRLGVGARDDAAVSGRAKRRERRVVAGDGGGEEERGHVGRSRSIATSRDLDKGG